MGIAQVMRRGGAVAIAAGGFLASASPAQAPQFAALSLIERGMWTLREAGGGAPRSMCVADVVMLFQVQTPAPNCTRLVIENEPRTATVNYSCRGAGYGRTTISVETPRLIRISSRGMNGGAPFDVDYEARKTGACGPTAAR